MVPAQQGNALYTMFSHALMTSLLCMLHLQHGLVVQGTIESDKGICHICFTHFQDFKNSSKENFQVVSSKCGEAKPSPVAPVPTAM